MTEVLKILRPVDFSSFSGEIKIAASKSLANRALLLQALSSNSFEILNLSDADDVLIMRKALNSKSERVNIGMAGTALRFLTAGFSILPGNKILDGDQRLKERPIKALIDALIELGANIEYLDKGGSLPIVIEGKVLQGNQIEIDQTQSSQFTSALMMIGPFLQNGLLIKRTRIKRSESYITLTKQLMLDMGFELSVNDKEILISNKQADISCYEVEGDWSSAAYLLAFVVLIPNASIKLSGLSKNSSQGDKEILIILETLGLNYSWEGGILNAFHSSTKNRPKRLVYNCSGMPDQAQTLAFLGTALGLEVELSGLETLSYKETNRLEALSNELQKLGLEASYTESKLFIKGNISVKSASLASYNDHRMAMAGSLLATKIDLEIENPAVVSKSYPSFWNDIHLLTTES